MQRRRVAEVLDVEVPDAEVLDASCRTGGCRGAEGPDAEVPCGRMPRWLMQRLVKMGAGPQPPPQRGIKHNDKKAVRGWVTSIAPTNSKIVPALYQQIHHHTSTVPA